MYLVVLVSTIVLLVEVGYTQSLNEYRSEISIGDNNKYFSLDLKGLSELFKDDANFVTIALAGDLGTNWKKLEIRVRLNNSWSGWAGLVEDTHNSMDIIESYSYAQLLFFNVNITDVEIRIIENNRLWSGFVDVYYPTGSESSDMNRLQLRDGCELPDYYKRSDWCPDGSCKLGIERVQTDVTHLIVHHSAGPNTSSNWDAVVRSIWHFHSVTRGWDDIGYNWLISPDGDLYEGRGEGIRGAHFCGHNSGTTGICMMGTYTDKLPTDAALMKLEQYLSWAAIHWEIDPLASTLHASSQATIKGVSGHRDACNTECPGQILWNNLNEIRMLVQDNIESCDTMDSGHGGDTTKLERDPNLFVVQWMPSTNTLKFELGRSIFRPLYVHLYDMNGRLLWRKRVKNQDRTINMSDLVPGAYIVHLESRFVEKTFKIMKF